MKSKFFYFVAVKDLTFFINNGRYAFVGIDVLTGQTRSKARAIKRRGELIHKFERTYPHKYLGTVR